MGFFRNFWKVRRKKLQENSRKELLKHSRLQEDFQRFREEIPGGFSETNLEGFATRELYQDYIII